MKIKTNYDGCPYITAGRGYITYSNDEGDIYIKDDIGHVISICLSQCPHLDGQDWQIVQEDLFSQEVAQEMYKFLYDLANGRGMDYPIEQLLAKARGEL